MLKREDGSALVLVSLLLFAIMGIMALVLDMGVVYAEKAKLSKAIDAAILAGGQELPDDKDVAREMMETYLVENDVSLDGVTISIDDDGLGAEIIGTKSVKHYFAKIMGFNSSDVTERSKIILGTAGSAQGGLRPFAVVEFNYNYGDLITLKEGAGDSYHGNFGAIALGGTGVPMLLDNALYGYDDEISIGDWINTEPGNMASMIGPIDSYINSFGGSYDNYDSDSDRLWTVPLVESLELLGRDAVQVVGFAQVFVEEVSKIGGDATIKVRFIEYVTNGEINTEIVSKGVLAMKLVD